MRQDYLLRAGAAEVTGPNISITFSVRVSNAFLTFRNQLKRH